MQRSNTQNMIKSKKEGVFEMRKYDKEFKEEAVKLPDEVGVKQAVAQLGIPYYTLAKWRLLEIMLLSAVESVVTRRFPKTNGH